MTLALIFKRPGLYLGSAFSTIDEFRIFVTAMGLLAEGSNLPEDEKLALRLFNGFVYHHLHGHLKNCSWAHDLLSRHGDHGVAIKAAMILFLEFAKMLRERGTEQVSEVLALAHSIEVINPAGRPERLERLISEAISIHSDEIGE